MLPEGEHFVMRMAICKLDQSPAGFLHAHLWALLGGSVGKA